MEGLYMRMEKMFQEQLDDVGYFEQCKAEMMMIQSSIQWLYRWLDAEAVNKRLEGFLAGILDLLVMWVERYMECIQLNGRLNSSMCDMTRQSHITAIIFKFLHIPLWCLLQGKSKLCKKCIQGRKYKNIVTTLIQSTEQCETVSLIFSHKR